jgi:hypothetical protein
MGLESFGFNKKIDQQNKQADMRETPSEIERRKLQEESSDSKGFYNFKQKEEDRENNHEEKVSITTLKESLEPLRKQTQDSVEKFEKGREERESNRIRRDKKIEKYKGKVRSTKFKLKD